MSAKAQPDINDTLRHEGEDAGRARHDQAWAKVNGKGRYTIADAHKLFTTYFGKDFDMQTADATLAVAATIKLTGDPPWLMVISGSGNAKTETVMVDQGRVYVLVVARTPSDYRSRLNSRAVLRRLLRAN